MTPLASLHTLLRSPGAPDLRAVARLFTDMLRADGTVAFVVDDEAASLFVGAAHPAGGVDERALRIPLGYGVTGLVAVRGRAVTMVDDRPRNEVHRRLLGLEPGATVVRLCVPMRGVGATVVGVINVHRHRGAAFTKDDLDTAQIFADLVGMRLYAQTLLEAAEDHQSQQDQLVAQAISAQEAERRRIAGDLHDGVTQALASAAFHLSAADVGLAGGSERDRAIADAKAQIQSARRLAGLAYDETRAAISGLHSLLLDDLGLLAALESLGQNVPQLDVELRGDSADCIGDVPDHCAAVLYRIAQEALNNVVKHAETRRAVVSLRRVGGALVLSVTDDGVGFDVHEVRSREPASAGATHYGIASIAERCALIGATLRIDSAKGRGTAVMVEVPLQSA